MSALDEIAELHSEIDRSHLWLPSICDACEQDWPCPTRRLCDEALGNLIGCAACTADRDRWKADADRLAAKLGKVAVVAARTRVEWALYVAGDEATAEADIDCAFDDLDAALSAAHDALVQEEGK